MIVATLRNPFLRPSAHLARFRILPYAKRLFASSHPTISPAAGVSPAAATLGILTAELDKLAPRFEIQSSKIRIIRTPSDFYSTLKVIG
jgi:CDP-diacylglycerol--glycerol-3-phosphate 3-phosphatidyltransferase